MVNGDADAEGTKSGGSSCTLAPSVSLIGAAICAHCLCTWTYVGAVVRVSNDSVTSGQTSEALCYHSLAALTSGSSSAVERQLPKLDVAGSIPVSRSNFNQRKLDANRPESLAYATPCVLNRSPFRYRPSLPTLNKRLKRAR